LPPCVIPNRRGIIGRMARREFKPVDALMGPALGRLAREGSAAAMGPLWAQAAGAQIARNVTPAAWEGGVLVLHASTARWQAEVTALAPQLVEKLNRLLGAPSVERIVVRSTGGK
jgi:hypothetical protein